jgi:hypothetical protein
MFIRKVEDDTGEENVKMDTKRNWGADTIDVAQYRGRAGIL